MNILEKILEEIEHESKLAHEEMRRCASKNPLQFDEVKGYARGVEYAVDIIRSHMNEAKDINVPSKDEIEPVSEEFLKDCAETAARYKRNFDNWIPVEERLPEEHDSIFAKFKGTSKWNGVMWERHSDEVNVTYELEDGTRKATTSYTLDGVWKLEKESKVVKKKVVAWQPLPEPYKGGDDRA